MSKPKWIFDESLLASIMETDRPRWTDPDLTLRANQGNVRSGRQHEDALSEQKHQSARVAKALRELYDILESHAPRWYTQEHHERAESALRRGGKASVDIIIELCGLLEEYAPRWYTKEHSERARSILKLLEQ
jgi:hypothetical protein